MPIPLPPLEEQRRIARTLDQAMSVLEAVEQSLDDEERRCVALRSAVLASAFSGTLVAQDPTDEPAELLLKQIAAERALTEQEAKSNKSMRKRAKGGLS
jgi:type I restriction enzyme S subunit